MALLESRITPPAAVVATPAPLKESSLLSMVALALAAETRTPVLLRLIVQLRMSSAELVAPSRAVVASESKLEF